MTRKCCPKLASLFRRENASSLAERIALLEKHRANCARCAEEFSPDALRPSSAMTEYFRRLEQVTPVQDADSNDPQPGQIWRVNNAAHDKILGVITCGVGGSLVPDSPDVRLSPVCQTTPKRFVSDGDVLVEPEESPLAARLVIEAWNDRPVLVRQLEECFGIIADAVLRRLKRALEGETSESVSSDVVSYREKRRGETQGFSSPVFRQLENEGLLGVHPDTVSRDEPLPSRPLPIRWALQLPLLVSERIGAEADDERAALDHLQTVLRRLHRKLTMENPLYFIVRETRNGFELRFPNADGEVVFGLRRGKKLVADPWFSKRRRIVFTFSAVNIPAKYDQVVLAEAGEPAGHVEG